MRAWLAASSGTPAVDPVRLGALASWRLPPNLRISLESRISEVTPSSECCLIPLLFYRCLSCVHGFQIPQRFVLLVGVVFGTPPAYKGRSPRTDRVAAPRVGAANVSRYLNMGVFAFFAVVWGLAVALYWMYLGWQGLETLRRVANSQERIEGHLRTMGADRKERAVENGRHRS